jgi:neutral ceramidase
MTAFSVGASRTDITAFNPDAELMGWAQPHNRARGVATPLHARAFVIRDDATGARVAIVNAEICFISESIRTSVVERLRAIDADAWSEENVLLLATHTHSGPGGYSHELFYTMTTPGFHPQILERLVQGIVDAIVDADARRQPATLQFASRPVPVTEPVAFNRSPRAYNRNRGVQRVDWRNRHLATDREMPVLEFVARNGEPIGSMSWFAVHCTSVHADYRWVCADNKGYAASDAEAWGRDHYGTDYIAAFHQGASGDVSPNFRYDPHRGYRVGVFDDDFASARFVGEIQAAHARQVLQAPEKRALSGGLDAALLRFDLGAVDVDPQYANGLAGRRTAPAELGLGFLEGTKEGPGPLNSLHGVNKAFHRARALRKMLAGTLGFSLDGLADPHGTKYPFLQTGRGGEGNAFGLFSMGNPQAPDWLDPTVAEARRLHEAQALGDGNDGRPWTQGVLPLQLVRIGSIALAALPIEATTMAGRRIQRSLERALAPLGVETVVIAGYANGYGSYLTTFEEYQEQCYEGSSTLFGQWTLGAFQTCFDQVARRLATPVAERRADLGPVWPRPTEAELAARQIYIRRAAKLRDLMG